MDAPHRIPLALRILHFVLLANFATNSLYCVYQLFVVLAPDGHVGPLWGAAADLSTDLVVKRRLYAIEFWVTIGAGSVYLAITEWLPRALRPLPPATPPAS
jgi:hypothetical protein